MFPLLLACFWLVQVLQLLRRKICARTNSAQNLFSQLQTGRGLVSPGSSPKRQQPLQHYAKQAVFLQLTSSSSSSYSNSPP
uniref:Putative secreted protein n=1 Tax=Anopheles marajoara TaxID=58244 RepID=A0A2M4CBH7_9DIPT